MHAAAADTASPAFPPYMAALIERAAELLAAHFPHCGPVPFTWWADGEACHYLARLEWPVDEASAMGPRVVVLAARSGAVLCASRPAGPFDAADPSCAFVDYADTAIARAAGVLRAHFPQVGPLTVTWCDNGERWQHLVRLVWPLAEAEFSPRVVLLGVDCGELLAQSPLGPPFAIDPASVRIDAVVAPDEAAELARRMAGAGRGNDRG